MKIRNISSKVIGIAGNVVMPDNEITVKDHEGNTAGVRALVNMGLLTITEEAKEVKKAEVAETDAEEDAEEVAEEKKPTRGRKKST